MDKDIFDFINRHQVYMEGVKNWYQDDFLRYLKSLANGLRKLFAGLSVSKLGELTKAAYNRFVRKVMDLVGKNLSNHGNEWMQEVRRIARIDTVVQRDVLSKLRTAKDFADVTVGKVWATVKDTPVPAFGMTIKEAAEDLINRSKEQARKIVAQGYVDAEEASETLKKLVGVDKDWTDGALRQIRNNARNMINTAIQHITSRTSSALGAVVYGCYQWISVLDSRTSATCRERNGEIYRYEEGPQPPAHPNCRSRTIPVPCGGTRGTVPTFFEWLKEQPGDFLNDAFGTTLARRIREGRVEVSELSAHGLIPALSIEEFERRTGMLMASTPVEA